MILLPPPPYCKAVTLHSAGTQQLANVNERFKNRPNIPRNGKKPQTNKQTKIISFLIIPISKIFPSSIARWNKSTCNKTERRENGKDQYIFLPF